jgi:hypothetical protein
MKDLFSNNRHGGRPGRIKVPLTTPPASTPTPQEKAPTFGTPAWDRCRCGRRAFLHFPNAGGIRRCIACAQAEGRFTPSTPIWSRAEIAGKDEP